MLQRGVGETLNDLGGSFESAWAVICGVVCLAELATPYGVRGLLIITTVLSVVSATGYVIDALLMLLFLGYSFVSAPAWKRLVSTLSPTRSSEGVAVSTSMWIVGTYAALAPVFSHVLWGVLGTGYVRLAFPIVLLLPVADLVWELVIGYSSGETRVIAESLPLTLIFNSFAGAILGKLLAKVALALPPNRTMPSIREGDEAVSHE